MIAVGIDPSLSSTGVALIGGEGSFELTTVRSAPASDLRGQVFRLTSIVRGVLRALPDRFDVLVIEEPNSRMQYGGLGERNGLYWLILSQMMSRADLLLPVTPSTRAAYAAGDHRLPEDGKKTSKRAVIAEQERRFPGAVFRNDDEADALAMASMGARFLGHPVERVGLGKRESAAFLRWAAKNK